MNKGGKASYQAELEVNYRKPGRRGRVGRVKGGNALGVQSVRDSGCPDRIRLLIRSDTTSNPAEEDGRGVILEFPSQILPSDDDPNTTSTRGHG